MIEEIDGITVFKVPALNWLPIVNFDILWAKAWREEAETQAWVRNSKENLERKHVMIRTYELSNNSFMVRVDKLWRGGIGYESSFGCWCAS